MGRYPCWRVKDWQANELNVFPTIWSVEIPRIMTKVLWRESELDLKP